MVNLTTVIAIMGIIARELPEQKLDDGTAVQFGQKVEDISARAGKPAVDDSGAVVRKGIDQQILLKDATLSFDSGRLVGMKFSDGYQFKHPLCPYEEAWKNFDPIDGKKIKSRMPRAEFVAYLALWEARAKALGVTKVDFGDLAAKQYRVSITQDKFFDSIYISLGPTRSTGRGGLWADGWSLFFTTKYIEGDEGKPVGLLKSLSVFDDDFNTNARQKRK